MGTLTPELRAFLDTQPVGVLATKTSSGRPRQSLVNFVRDGQRLLISTLSARLKARAVQRAAWASLCVIGHQPPYASATFSGQAEVLTHDIGRPTAAIAQRMTQASEPPEPQTDEALAAIDRVVLAKTIEHISAVNYIPTTGPASSGGC
jgi:PPOX class probable F420-dependent enzyme